MGNRRLIQTTAATAGLLAILLQAHGIMAVAAVEASVANSSSTVVADTASTSVSATEQPGQTRMAIETPLNAATVPPVFAAAGYAFDPESSSGSGVDAVVVYAYRNFGSGEAPTCLGAATYGIARDDVAGAFGTRFRNSGFELTVSGLSTGNYRVIAFAHNVAAGAYSAYVFADITVGGFSVVSIGTPAADATVTSSFEVDGWAIDNRAAAGTGIDAVHIYLSPNGGADAPVFIGVASYGWMRSDVGAAYGARFAASGYHFTVSGAGPGDYVLGVYAHSTATNSFSLVTQQRFTISGTALLAIGGPSAESTISRSPFSVNGWSIDRSAASGTGVDALHVYAYPNPGSGQAALFLGVATQGIARSDVASLYGDRYLNSGYELPVDGASLAPGVYDIVVWSHSTASGTFNAAAVVRVRIQ
jgi:hypothetical protein